MRDFTKFKKDGYLKKNLFVKEDSFKKIKLVFRDYFKEICKPHLNAPNFNIENELIHKKIIEFRKRNPKKFGSIYDDLKLNANLRSIFFKDDFLNLFSKLLGTSKNKIYVNGFMLRLDVPNDKRNTLDWHQDSPYYQMTYPKFNAGVCWVSITNNSAKNGSLTFLPKSHNKFSFTKLNKKSKYSSGQFRIPVSNKNEKLAENLNSKSRDIDVLHMLIKHKSGINTSKKIRINLGCRFHSMDDKFNSGDEVFIFNKTDKTILI